MKKISRRFLFLARPALPALLLAALCRPAFSAFNASVVAGVDADDYTVSWDAAVDPSTSAASTYAIYTNAANTVGLIGGTTPNTLLATGITGTSYVVAPGVGSRCFRVRASNVLNTNFDTSNTVCHAYLHCTAGGNTGCVSRVDGAGTQLGFGQQWKWTYFLDKDSEMTVQIFSSGTVFYTDATTGFSTTTATNPLKTIVDHTPRSGERGISNSNTETWDMRDSSGAVVSNGIYFVYFIATNPLLTPTTRYAGVDTIPVNTIRFTALTTVGITPSSALGTINYSITGDASVRMVIAKPGRKFTIDGNGDVQALNAAGTAIDTSTTSVVQVIAFNRKAGAYSETWNGTDSSGVSVSSGIYTVGISARDGFGNRALDLTGNNGALSTTLPVDRSESQAAVDVTAPTISDIVVNPAGQSIVSSINPTISGSASSIVVTLNEAPGSQTTISVTGPLGAIAGSTAAAVGMTVTFTPTVAMSTAGAYTVAVVGVDALGNGSGSAATSKTFTLSGSAAAGAPSQTAEDFKNSVTAYPNPVRASPARIDFTVQNPATVDIDFFTITGQRLYHKSVNYAAGAQSFLWSLVNDAGNAVGSGVYLVRITANDGTSTFRATRKIMIIR